MFCSPCHTTVHCTQIPERLLQRVPALVPGDLLSRHRTQRHAYITDHQSPSGSVKDPFWRCLLQDRRPEGRSPGQGLPAGSSQGQIRKHDRQGTGGPETSGRRFCPGIRRGFSPLRQGLLPLRQQKLRILDVRTHNGTRLSACACRKDTASSGTEQNLSHRT